MAEQLRDGDVMDYVKNQAPYKDERFTEQPKILDTVAEPPVVRTAIVVAQPAPTVDNKWQVEPSRVEEAFREAVDDDDVWEECAGTRTPRHEEEAAIQASVLGFNQLHGAELMGFKKAMVVPPHNPDLAKQSQTVTISNPMNPLNVQPAPDKIPIMLSKIQARREALESLDDKTPEIKATIKALDWAIGVITS